MTWLAVRRALPLCILRKLRALLSTALASAALSAGSCDSSRSAGVFASPFSSARHRASADACSAAAAADSVWLRRRVRPWSRGSGPSTTAPSKRSGGGDPPACITPHRSRVMARADVSGLGQGVSLQVRPACRALPQQRSPSPGVLAPPCRRGGPRCAPCLTWRCWTCRFPAKTACPSWTTPTTQQQASTRSDDHGCVP
jgi:hypothetical protein